MNASRKPAVHGHRGARGLYPENTLAGIRAAMALGCDAVEIDLCVTADDHLAVVHDPILSPDIVRDHSGQWISGEHLVHRMTLKELRRLDVGRIRPGGDYQRQFNAQAPVDGARIPTLGEVVELVHSRARSGARPLDINLELKSTPSDPRAMPAVERYAARVAREITRLDVARELVVQSFDWRLPLAVKELLPELRIGLTTDTRPDAAPRFPAPGESSVWTGGRDPAGYGNSIPRMIVEAGARVWSTRHLDVNAENLAEARGLGLEVWAWTVNETADMQRMAELGVDAVVTDYPDRWRELFGPAPA